MSQDQATEHGPRPTSWKSLQKVRIVKQDASSTAKRAASPSGHMQRAVRSENNAPIEPYRSYKPRPFTREERDQVTVLFGGLHWRAERVIQGALENLGYRAQILPTATRDDLLTGREIVDIGQCCPTSFTTGNRANFLRAEAQRIGVDEVAKRYVHVTAGSCGACHFGQYHQSYELALRNVGLQSFRLFLLGQDGLDQGPANGGGLEINMPFTLGAVWAVVVTDIVQDMEYQTRPYEKNPGATERVARECVEQLYEVFRKRPMRGKKWGSVLWHFGTDYFVKAMREARALRPHRGRPAAR